MSSSRIAAVFAAGFLGALVYFGLGCRQKVDPALKSAETAYNDKVLHDPALEKKLGTDLPRVDNVINKDASNHPDLNPAFTNLFTNAAAGISNAVSAPIKVRGGSMTAFTSITGGWIPVNGGYCVNVENPTQIQIENLLNDQGDPGAPPPTIGGTWKVEIYGHEGTDIDTHGHPHHHGTGTGPNYTRPSNYGLRFVGQAHTCDSQGTTPSILMRLINDDNNSKVGFYADILPPAKPWVDNRRFMDWSTGYDPAGAGGSDGKPDGEYRERMYQVKITPTVTPGSPTPKTVTYTCPDGDCTIWMGAPQ